MIEETATVVETGPEGVWVESEPHSACGQCQAASGCGTSALARVLGRRRSRVRVLADQPLRVGDRVTIGIREQALVRGSLALYAVPLAALLAGALLGKLGAGADLWQSAEAGSVLLGLAGLVAGLVWVRRFGRRIRNDRAWQPVVLRRQHRSGLNLVIED
ncbi:MAG TPA: Fis family transcriptional regulator [Gammaproteobacteria bacterium]|nr:Fis family transcriptional regulator [Gammaproteobacteria bacterium]